jgi:hypothetical protein
VYASGPIAQLIDVRVAAARTKQTLADAEQRPVGNMDASAIDLYAGPIMETLCIVHRLVTRHRLLQGGLPLGPMAQADLPRPAEVDWIVAQAEALPVAIGFGRIVVSEIEVPSL